MFIYEYNITGEEGDYVVTFPAVPEALTGAETLQEAKDLARDCLLEALAGYIDTKEPIPVCFKAQGEDIIYLRPLEVAKVSLHNSMLEHKMSNAALANKLDKELNIIRRWLNLKHNSKIEDINTALRIIFGKRLVTTLMDA